MAKKGVSLKRKHSNFFNEKKRSSKEFIPWIEEFAPLTIQDLAVHKKKISEVQSWFQNFFSFSGQGKISPILLLTGPPGVGKTATVKAVCQSLNAELFIWSNTHQEKQWRSRDEEFIKIKDDFMEGETQTASFNRFLLHSAKYSLYSNCKRVILVEEFPNALIRNPGEFHLIMKKFYLNGKYPSVFIISDNTKGDSEENRLFPKDLQASLKIANISFNPIAPTMLMKVLTTINNSSKLDSGCVKLNKSQLDSIASDSNGDIRNAINTMQFLCMTQSAKPKSSHKNDASSKAKESEECSSKRDSSLFLFHALGKILYCKRDPALKSETDILPATMKSLERDPLISNPEEVYEKTSISADAFMLFLQENYLSFVEDIKIVSESSAWLSEADVFSAYWNGQDTLNDYAVSLASRGLMFNMVSNSLGRRWRPLHKPQFYENNKRKNHLTNTLKHTFKGNSLSLREVQIDLVPFIPKLYSKSFNTSQINLAKEIGEMNVKKISRPVYNALDEKDCFQLDTNELEDIVTDSQIEQKGLEIPDIQISDEEIIIEEYDF
ncbi:Cell cycle checkpoint protein RAD17 like protein [Argiope bruennichi]|uniref:Cell cycle checkpoint protein RAD17 like protein n=1 Tax=Argiope bruennichi TaxID=94029 RepID=A0A8T0EN40_ARGBR|nr:Cell cycle checkpoint protein RAD17 like protein [Argiope bruennichi]